MTIRRRGWVVVLVLSGAFSGAGSAAGLQARVLGKMAASSSAYRDGDKLATKAAAAAASDASAGSFKTTAWDSLMPKDWNPMQGMSLTAMMRYGDGDPRAMAALDKLKASWDRAPVVPAMENADIRIAGFVVPLDGEGEALHEFLLVPYFGACIHTPPPPANQVIHVTLNRPMPGVRMMDTVWVGGRLHLGISDTPMGISGYRMDGQTLAPYTGQ